VRRAAVAIAEQMLVQHAFTGPSGTLPCVPLNHLLLAGVFLFGAFGLVLRAADVTGDRQRALEFESLDVGACAKEWLYDSWTVEQLLLPPPARLWRRLC
jgi:hypothetical protein